MAPKTARRKELQKLKNLCSRYQFWMSAQGDKYAAEMEINHDWLRQDFLTQMHYSVLKLMEMEGHPQCMHS